MGTITRKLRVYAQISLDGYFTDSQSDISWAHHSDPEWKAFTEENASSAGPLIFGRSTYEMMASFWPTPMAASQMPVVAERMNHREKLVFSRTLKSADWNNSIVFDGEPGDEIRRLKAAQGPDMTILGSGSIVAQLAGEGLIDEYQIVVNPIVLGGGRTLFEGLTEGIELRLFQTRTFGDGSILLCYLQK